jgi:NADPH2:quinone reductase
MCDVLLEHRLAPLFASGTLKPVIDRVLPLEKAADAHAYLAANEGFGKVVLTMG